MKKTWFGIAAVLLFTSPSFQAADLPAIPEQPIANKKELLFSDNFKGAEHPKEWHRVVDTFVFENGMLKGSQTRDKDVPAADGKPAVQAHAAVFGLDVPTKDSVVEVKVKLAGAKFISVEFDDRKFTGSHYGHICLARIYSNSTVELVDQRDGNQNEEIIAMRKDPAKKDEAAKRLVGHSATYKLATKIEPDKWYTFTVEIAGDEMRASLDGKPVGYLKSTGIGHPTKSKIELGVGGKDGFFDDIKVWNAEAAVGKP